MNPIEFIRANPLLDNLLGLGMLLATAGSFVYLARTKIGLRRNRARVVDED